MTSLITNLKNTIEFMINDRHQHAGINKEHSKNHICGIFCGSLNSLTHLTYGFNYTTPFKIKKNINLNKTVHAEEMALLRINKKALNNKKLTLIVIRIEDSKILRNSKPCINCMNMIKNNFRNGIKIKRICYSTDDGGVIIQSINDFLYHTIHKLSALNDYLKKINNNNQYIIL